MKGVLYVAFLCCMCRLFALDSSITVSLDANYGYALRLAKKTQSTAFFYWETKGERRVGIELPFFIAGPAQKSGLFSSVSNPFYHSYNKKALTSSLPFMLDTSLRPSQSNIYMLFLSPGPALFFYDNNDANLYGLWSSFDNMTWGLSLLGLVSFPMYSEPDEWWPDRPYLYTDLLPYSAFRLWSMYDLLFVYLDCGALLSKHDYPCFFMSTGGLVNLPLDLDLKAIFSAADYDFLLPDYSWPGWNWRFRSSMEYEHGYGFAGALFCNIGWRYDEGLSYDWKIKAGIKQKLWRLFGTFLYYDDFGASLSAVFEPLYDKLEIGLDIKKEDIYRDDTFIALNLDLFFISINLPLVYDNLQLSFDTGYIIKTEFKIDDIELWGSIDIIDSDSMLMAFSVNCKVSL